ncbi:MAG: histidine phosphatase family protein [Rhodospirillales bacterium]|nr:histidine phosphatase family protein [Rhodospirillales bacterium]
MLRCRRRAPVRLLDRSGARARRAGHSAGRRRQTGLHRRLGGAGLRAHGRPRHRHAAGAAVHRIQHGADQIRRTARVIERMTTEHEGRDIVAVAHGGTVRAAVAHALGLAPEQGMAITVGTLSVSVLEHVKGGLLRGRGGAWRVVSINRRVG